MKRIVFAVLFLCLGASMARAAYVQSIVTQTAFQTVSNNWAAPDDASLQVAIGFTFQFNNTNYTQVFIGSNGALTFTAGSSDYVNSAMPIAATPTDRILPFWDDLNRAAGGTITYGTLGSAPNRQFIVSWNAVPRYNVAGSSCSLQVILGEDQSIRFRYSAANVNCNGSTATTGVQENTTVGNYIQRSSDTAISLTQDVLYNRVPTLNVQKTVAVLCDPLNGASNPKAIPGSLSRWAITVTNTGLAPAMLTQINDTLAANTSFDANLVTGASAASCVSAVPPGVAENAVGRGFLATISGGTRSGFPKYLTSVSDGDGASFISPGSLQIDYTVLLPAATGYAAGELKAGESVTLYFNATLN